MRDLTQPEIDQLPVCRICGSRPVIAFNHDHGKVRCGNRSGRECPISFCPPLSPVDWLYWMTLPAISGRIFPCRRCGYERPEITHEVLTSDDVKKRQESGLGPEVEVWCRSCHNSSGFFTTEETAIAFWNKGVVNHIGGPTQMPPNVTPEVTM